MNGRFWPLINPDEHLLRSMLEALDQQIRARRATEVAGEWVPPWKYPVNWLAQKSWEDEVRIELTEESRDAKRRTTTKKSARADMFWNPEGEGETSASEAGYEQDNVIDLQCYRQS